MISRARMAIWASISLLLFTTTLHATERRVIVVEAVGGSLPEAFAPQSEILARELNNPEVQAGPPLADWISANVSRNAGNGERPVEVETIVEEGRRQFIEGEYVKAIAQLEHAKQITLSHIAQVVNDEKLKLAWQQILLVSAHAYWRIGKENEALTEMEEAIRTFPNENIPIATYGPELADLYRRARRRLSDKRSGSLIVETEPPGCLVFLNEGKMGGSPARMDGLFPGVYRVYVELAGAPGRVHFVEVTAGKRTTLRVNHGLDTVLKTAPFVGFFFSGPEAMNENGALYAARLGSEAKATEVLLVGRRFLAGREFYAGELVSSESGAVVRSAAVALGDEDPPPYALRALGQYLIDDEATDGLAIQRNGPLAELTEDELLAMSTGPSAPSESSFWSAGVWRWITLGIAVGAAGAAVPMFILDGQGTGTCNGNTCSDEYNTMPFGIALAGVAGAAAIASGVLFYLDAQSSDDDRADHRQTRNFALIPWGTAQGAGMMTSIYW